jgi:hypothetical protein
MSARVDAVYFSIVTRLTVAFGMEHGKVMRCSVNERRVKTVHSDSI